MTHFIMLLLRFFVFDLQQFESNVSGTDLIQFILFGSLLSFLDVYIHVFHQIQGVFSY